MSTSVNRARTNYFRVKDVEALKLDLRKYGIIPATWEESRQGAEFVLDDGSSNKPEGSITLFGLDGWPSLDEDSICDRLDIDLDESPELPSDHEDLTSLVASHLVQGDVAVFMEVGFDKMRQLYATSVAVNSQAETRVVNLDDIYTIAAELTPTPSEASISHATW